MTNAAALALCGLPALRYLHTKDPDERVILAAIARRCDALRIEDEKRLATLIANAFVKARLHG